MVNIKIRESLGHTIFDPELGLNSKQLDSLSLDAWEQTVVAKYVPEPADACTVWGLKSEPVVGEGSAYKTPKKKKGK